MTVLQMLRLASPMMRGDDVRALQSRLAALGYSPGTVDGVFGDATVAAVRAFQQHVGLAADGVVGPRTVAALGAATVQGHTNGEGTMVGRRALAEAFKHVGTKEDPARSNRTPFGDWFGINGVPWCNIFVSYCFKQGANYTLCKGFNGAGVYAKGCTYVPTTEAWLRGSGFWVGRTTPAPGDIAIFNWDQKGVPEHIGIVEANLGGGRFSTIEGNTAIGNDTNGGEVMRRERTVGTVDGFGRITA